MKRRIMAAGLSFVLLFVLGACGRSRAAVTAEPAPVTPTSQGPVDDSSQISAAQEAVRAVYPLAVLAFSSLETEEMVCYNAHRCALMIINYYYCCAVHSDDSRSLVRYEIIDNGFHHRTVLLDNCGGEYLSFDGEKLWCICSDGSVVSLLPDGSDLKTELSDPCRSLQLRDGTAYCLADDGRLFALRDDALQVVLADCAAAFVSDNGIFFTTLSDGRAHLFDNAGNDWLLTDTAAQGLTVIGTTLYYASSESDGKHLCSLDLLSGNTIRSGIAFTGPFDLITGSDGSWIARLYDPDGGLTIPLNELASSAGVPTEPGRILLCRGLDGDIRTDEVFSSDGSSLGLVLDLPGGFRFEMPPDT